MRSLLYSFVLLLVVSLVGCDGGIQNLDVENESNPDRERVLAQPNDLQSIAAGTFETFHRGTEGQVTLDGSDLRSPSLSTSVLADAHTASWGNFAMRESGKEPRVTWNNDPAFTYAAYNEQPYFQSYTTISNALDVLVAVNDIGAQSINAELGAGGAARLRAFVNFNMGLSYLYLGARYDKGALIDETEDFQGEEFVPWPRVVEFGLSKMQNAISIANNNEFTIPGTSDWFFGNEMTSAEFAALANSMRAKYATLAARTPDQRRSLDYLDNVDWSTINTWIDNGMRSAPNGYSGGVFGPRSVYPGSPAGFFPNAMSGTGFPRQYDGQLHFAESNPFGDTWARADYKSIGPANTATNADGDNKYSLWKEELDGSPEDGVPLSALYVTETPDARIVGSDPTCGELVGRVGFPEGICGDSPDAALENAGDGLYFGFRGTAASTDDGELVAAPRPGPFPPSRGQWHYSDRAHDRYLSWQLPVGEGSFLGPMPHTLKAEMDLLKAEAILQSGGSAADAAALINNSRVDKGGMPPADGSIPEGSITDEANPLINGSDVGRSDATLYSMLKYEFTIETWNTSSGVNWMAKRGWGILREGSQLSFPIPGAEINTLGEEIYTFGGVGGRCAAGNYSESACRSPFGSSGGGNGGNIVLEKNNADSHWSTLPGADQRSTTTTLTLDPK